MQLVETVTTDVGEPVTELREAPPKECTLDQQGADCTACSAGFHSPGGVNATCTTCSAGSSFNDETRLCDGERAWRAQRCMPPSRQCWSVRVTSLEEHLGSDIKTRVVKHC